MQIKNLINFFVRHCNKNKLEVNSKQIEILHALIKFYIKNFSTRSIILNSIFSNKKKSGFYLHGDVGVGKTMILNFFYENLNISKKRMHFNEFMVNFHDFAHESKNKNNNNLELFVKDIKQKYKLIYFDEFQVTNIVDAMILGRLFETMFRENIKIIITSNIKIDDLYKDGLQRDQFLPFISTIKKFCTQQKLVISKDYRSSKIERLKYFFHPINVHTKFKINQIFRKLTRGKIFEIKKIKIKGRDFIFNNYCDKVARFSFNELCNKNIGSEDYIKIADQCDIIIIENILDFSDENMNQQQRFITMIDIIYEKKISLIVSANSDLKNLGSSEKLIKPFKRTVSRLYELTSP